MKILIAHNYYKQAGGEDQCVAAETSLLRRNGHEVVQYSLHNDAIDRMTRIRAASRTIWSRAARRDLLGLIRRHRPEILHCHNTFPLMSPAAYYAARAEGVSVVQTLHNFRLICPNATLLREGGVCEDCLGRSIPWPGVVHKCYRESWSASATLAAMLTVHRAIGTWRKAVDVYIALTQFGRNKFIEGGLPEDKIAIKSNFLSFDPGIGVGSGGYVVFVGRLCVEKGLETLLAAWKRLRANIPLKIVGDGPLAGRIQEAAASDGRIEWLGRRSTEDVLSLVGNATCLVLPSHSHEGFPLVIIEAFAKGTPVVTSKRGALLEVVDHGRTGLHFAPGDAADLASAVQRLSSDPAERNQMCQAARREFEHKYTAEINYRNLMEIYERAMAGNKRAASSGRRRQPRLVSVHSDTARASVLRTEGAHDRVGTPAQRQANVSHKADQLEQSVAEVADGH